MSAPALASGILPPGLPSAAALSTLIVLGVLDAAFSGFRASAGRDGLVRHRRRDLVGSARGLAVLALSSVPPLPLLVVGLNHGASLDDWAAAANAMLVVYLPYGLVVLGALAAYALLPWEVGYLATALLLGPLTLARPLVAVVGAVLAWSAVDSVMVRLGVVLSVLIVLGVERDVSRRWYVPARP
ncbi:hypothetical protein [Intrasporangium sp. YIM S08009]|uniref:hypothetical protein n=1 Tax=Intrasporangium zincisolvens TaxID=3080018 RepID=UPI002B062428|nr:hypothetical protein [Intrasporangium sp. YIM S08009]